VTDSAVREILTGEDVENLMTLCEGISLLKPFQI
jgi:hypothetical protein